MIRLYKGEEPRVLRKNKNKWTREYASDQRQRGYNDQQIKKALLQETHNKCAYCEGRIRPTSFGDVEHILPRSKRKDLVFDWKNLTIACEVCNRSGKGDYYDEKLPLINPYKDDPRAHFVFVGSCIYPRDENKRSRKTIDVIKLNRIDLIEARNKRLDGIKKMVIQWNDASESKKKVLYEAIIQEASRESEFSACVSDYLITVGFIDICAK